MVLSDWIVADEILLRNFEIFGIWFTGLATFGAVVVSLYLATHKLKPKLRVTADAKIIISSDNSDRPEIVSVKVANSGHVPTTIVSFGWQIGLLKKAYLAQMPDQVLISAQLPTRLEIGESASFNIRYQLAPEKPWIDDISEIVLGTVKWYQPLWLVLWTIKTNIWTATDHGFEARVSTKIRDDIRKSIEQGGYFRPDNASHTH